MPLLQGGLEEGDDWVLVIGHHKNVAELVKQSLELGAPHVLIVHNLFQVVVSSEVVQQPGNSQQTQTF